MNAKNIAPLLLVLLACLSRLHCGRPAPLSGNGAAVFELRLSFAGKKVGRLTPGLGKTGQMISGAPVITKLVFRVLDGPEGQVIASDSIGLAPGDLRFRTELIVPTGEDRVIEVSAFENLDINADQRFEEVRSFLARQTGITVSKDDTMRIPLTLFPLSIPGFRVVLDVGDGDGAIGSPGNPVAIGLANHDNLRGLQFDLVYNGSVLEADTLNGIARLARFSNIVARNLAGPSQAQNAYRIIIIDQGRPPGEIPPSPGVNVPEPIVTVLFKVNPLAGARQDTLRIVSASATNTALKNFEVYVVEGVFSIK